MIVFVSLLMLTHASASQNLLLTIPKVNAETTTFPIFSIFNMKNPCNAQLLLNQTTRMEIYSFVADNPGLHFRALSDSLNMPVGVLQYHLGLLVNGGLLSALQDGRYKRYFKSKVFNETEIRVISILRHTTSGKILSTIFKRPHITHKELASSLNISSQALSWHMKRLKETNLIKTDVEGISVKYSIDDSASAIVGRYASTLIQITS
jgi:predicted transcriptional regulator